MLPLCLLIVSHPPAFSLLFSILSLLSLNLSLFKTMKRNYRQVVSQLKALSLFYT